jgi:hypothetical protein
MIFMDASNFRMGSELLQGKIVRLEEIARWAYICRVPGPAMDFLAQ